MPLARARDPFQGPYEVEFFTLASLVERRLGQFEASIRNGEKAVELDPQNAAKRQSAMRVRQSGILPPNVDAVLGPGCEMRLAEVLVMTGDREGAFDSLGKLVKLPFGANQGDLKLNPMWDDLRNDPRFDRLLAESALPLVSKPAVSSTHQ